MENLANISESQTT